MATWWSAPTSHHAYYLSWISVIITLLAGSGGVTIYTLNGSSLMLAYGVENFVDFLSSSVVLWRFYCPGDPDEATEKRLARREKRASIAISIILGILGGGILAAAIDDLVKGAEDEEKYKLVLGVSFVSILVFGVLTVIKFHYGNRLQSASLHKDAICSLIGTALSGALFFNTLIISHYEEAWWIDPLVAIICGVVAIVIGLYAIIVAACIQKIPIYSCRWWFTSQGDGLDEVTGRPLGPEDMLPEGESTGTTEMTSIQKGDSTNESHIL